MNQSVILIINYAAMAMIPVAIVALPIFLVSFAKYRNISIPPGASKNFHWANFPIRSAAFFVIPIVMCFVLSYIVISIVRSHVKSELNSLSGDYEVLINGVEVKNPKRVIEELITFQPTLGHHSHPTLVLNVKIISGNGTLKLKLGRDSSLPQEYWVFYPRYLVTSTSEIGRVNTSIFDNY